MNLKNTAINVNNSGWNWAMISYKNSINTVTGYLDGLVGNSKNPNTNPSNNSTYDFEVGRHPGVANYANVDMAEIVIAKGTNAEDGNTLSKITQYINQQWGL